MKRCPLSGPLKEQVHMSCKLEWEVVAAVAEERKGTPQIEESRNVTRAARSNKKLMTDD